MKKLFTTLVALAMATTTTFACLTEEPIFDLTGWTSNKNELYGTFKDTNAYTNPDNTTIATVKVPSEVISGNNIILSLPATISIQVDKFNNDNEINQIRLEYEDKSGNWVTVKDLIVTYDLSTSAPVPHFGINTLDPAGFEPGDTLRLRIFVSDGLYEAEIEMNCIVEDNRRPQ